MNHYWRYESLYPLDAKDAKDPLDAIPKTPYIHCIMIKSSVWVVEILRKLYNIFS